MNGVVELGSGAVRGTREGGAWVFRGVPYGADPGGGYRWRRTLQPERWTGVRDASAWGVIAPQSPPTPGLSIPGDPRSSGEDCLSLNVWSPGLDDRARPVLLWIHGGGFTTGTGASALYDGARLATRGDVVVVTFNYRLGALGFLAHPALGSVDQPGCGNWGLWDQLAVLGWVQDNISSFGGAPGNVTVFGESAGAMSICALLATDACGRLFHKAVVQSGPPATCAVPWATRRAQRLVELLAELSPDASPESFDRRSLLEVDPGDLVRGVEGLSREAPRDDGLPLALMPVVDGGLLDRPPADAVADGAAASVPLMIGTNRDEASLFVVTDPSAQDIDMDAVVRRIARVTSMEAAEQVVEAYRAARVAREEPVSARDVLTAITSDYVFRVPSLELAASAYKHQPSTFTYLFDWESPFLGGILGSSHGLEVPFVFGTVEDAPIAPFSGSGAEASELSAAMQQAWISFARDGDPSCDALGDWPAYDPIRRPTMTLGSGEGVAEDPRHEERRAWEDAGVEIVAGHHHEA